MRFILLALLSMPVFAQVADRALTDLMYLPKAGTVYGETAFDWSGGQYNQDKTTEVDTHTLIASQELGFGFTDMISVNLSYEHQINGEESTRSGTSERTYVDTEGMMNPTLTGVWRVMEQGSAEYNLDIAAAYSPDMVDSEGSSNDEEFTAGSGNATYTIGARMGQKNGTDHWALEAVFQMEGEGETELTNGDKQETDAYYAMKVGYSMQKNMLPWMDFRANVNLSRVSSKDVEESGTETEYDPYWMVDFGGKLLVSPIKDTLMAYVGVGMFYSQGFDVESGGTTTEIKDFKGWTASLGALYQF
jgi:hypothetical protein